MSDKVTISVHRRLDEPGYIVRITDGDSITKLPTATYEEAEALATSIKEYVEVGLPISVFLGDRHDNRVEPSDGCPRCGCREVDELEWDEDCTEVTCARCGKRYVPRAEE